MNLRSFLLAVQFLTRLPTPGIAEPQPGELAGTAPYVPLVGLMVGAIVAIAACVFGYITPWVGALAGVVAWVWVTGGLHLDGLADVADAFGAAHRDPQRFVEVLKDPHTGAYGVMAIGLQLMAKLVLLAAVVPAHWPWVFMAIALIAAWARWGTLAWSLYVPPLRPGLGQSFSGGLEDGAGRTVMLGWAGALIIASSLVAPWLLAAPVIVALIALYWRHVLGGLTGDCLGASVEVTESLLLLALAAGYAF